MPGVNMLRIVPIISESLVETRKIKIYKTITLPVIYMVVKPGLLH
jgi:hypothetical protein